MWARTWTEDRIELLTKLWREGLSASQIAAELGGGVSRNSVLGKARACPQLSQMRAAAR